MKIIVAPHCDDEIIGCYENLSNDVTIIYDKSMSKERISESQILINFYPNIKQIFCKITHDSIFFNMTDKSTRMYFPDPIYEVHPLHRDWGCFGEKLARNGYDVIFYSTNMNAPYIHECKNKDEKRTLLDSVYQSQKGLWQFDNRYFLFEGYCKWIF